MKTALSAFLEKLAKEKLDGFIVTNHFNIFYLCGFRGISPTEREAILIFAKGPTLITAKLYQTEAKRLTAHHLKVKIAAERNQIFETVKKLFRVGLPTEALAKVGFEEEDLRVAELSEFKKALSHLGSDLQRKTSSSQKGPTLKKLIPFKNFIEDLRVIKSADELARIEKAQIISQKAFESLVKTIKIGQSEAEIADRLSKIIKSLDGQGLAFESIVATGPNSARPHYLTGLRPIAKGEVLLFDFGAKYQDYCADITRTVFVGKPKTEQENIYRLVEKAQQEAINSISAGIKASDAYLKAHDIFKNKKLHTYFLHGLGHGIGLEVHERPHLRLPRPTIDGSIMQEELTEGMVFSIEPGLYFPDWGGVRIEDLVTIKNGKAKVLGKLTEEIIII